MDRTRRSIVALVAAAGILIAVGWFDTVVLRSAQTHIEATFDQTPLAWAISLGWVIAAAGVLTVAILARWSASLLVGVTYILVGAFITFVFHILLFVGPTTSATGPSVPGPLFDLISKVWEWTAEPLGHLGVVGAGMLLAGIWAIVLVARRGRAGRDL